MPTPSAPAVREDRTRTFATATALGAVAFLVEVAWTWQPSAWRDEAATASMVERSNAALIGTALNSVDAVHGLYYLLLKQWASLVGPNVAALRIPSALGAAVGAVLIYLLARRLAGGTFPVLATAVFIALPSVTWAAGEARSYGWAMTASVAVVLCFVRAIEGGFRRRWLVYCAVAAAASYLFLYCALVVLANLLAVVLAPLLRRRWLPASVSTLGAGSIVLPLAVVAAHQTVQIAWLPTFGPHLARDIALQWFQGSALFAVPAAVLLVLGVIRLVRTDRLHPVWWPVVAWLVVPTTLLVVVTATGHPLYFPRYTLVSAPAAALFIANGARALRRLAPLAVAVLVICSVPGYVQQRVELGKGEDWALVAVRVRSMSGPGVGIYFTGGLSDLRPMLASYPRGFAGVEDIALRRRGSDEDRLWDTTVPLRTAASRTGKLTTVLVVSPADVTPQAVLAEFRRTGFERVARFAGPITTVWRMSRARVTTLDAHPPNQPRPLDALQIDP